MLTSKGIYLIEYNIRFGDPEAEVLLPRLKSDLLSILWDLSQGNLTQNKIVFSNQSAICVVMAARNYPDIPVTGGIITNIDQAESDPNVKIFHAGTKLNENNQLYAAGGRVLCVSALGDTLTQAQQLVYQSLKQIKWQDAIWRNDIGNRALNYVK